MEFASFADLRRFSANVDGGMLLKQASAETYQHNVFLSYSSKDHDLLPGVISVLQNHGGRVYIDKLDPALPELTNRGTAERLRLRIAGCRRFVMFVTTNTKGSRWVPWELGLADGEKQEPALALFPSTETAGETEWANQEYLGLYRRIVWGKHRDHEKPIWMVLDHRVNTATELSAWLAGG